MRTEGWQEHSFSEYDTVYHVAGIAHSDTRKASAKEQALYYSVNTDLAIECAKKAKKDGVRQFIFMSSIIVYGDSAPIGKMKIIKSDTPLSPANFYGDSKKKAEEGIITLRSEEFKVVILRPPMIYGKGSKGNYPQLARLARTLPIFPEVKNYRSMLYITNLCEFIRLMIENEEDGVFFPQNKRYMNTSRLVCVIGKVHGKKVMLVKGFQVMIKIAGKLIPLVNKVFGNLVIDKELSIYKNDYQLVGTMLSIRESEK